MRMACLVIGTAGLLACASDDATGDGEDSGDTSSSSTTVATTVTTTATTTATTATTTASVDDTTTTDDMESSSDASSSSDSGEDTGDGSIYEMCFDEQYVNVPIVSPNYDQFMPTIGSHCLGTNHQDILEVDRVVFLGDSITVGTPPTLSADYYRSKLADALAMAFALEWGEGLQGQDVWQLADPFNGTAAIQESGDFASCAKWGGRNDDLLEGNMQLEDCFPPETRELRNLVIITSGGNDLSSLTQDMIDGVPMEELWQTTMDAVELKRQAVQWLKDPERFPNGTHVVFANIYEFTDGTGEVMSCDVSGLAGFDQPVPSPASLATLVIWANEQYMEIATENDADMIFLLESFCGHGFQADNPEAPCYRGPGSETWFDLTCIHPNPTGHQQIADMFLAVVGE